MGREGDAAELLELVRSAEQGAFVATAPAGHPRTIGPAEEEFVDVDDEAIEATPSTSLRAGVLVGRPRSEAPRAARSVRPEAAGELAWPPATSIALVLGLAVLVLALVAR